MRKFLIATLVFMMMSAGALAAEKPNATVLILEPQFEIPVEDKNVLSDEFEDIVICNVHDSKVFNVMDTSVAENDRMKTADVDIDYVVTAQVLSMNRRETTSADGLKKFKSRVEIELSLVDMETHILIGSAIAKANGKSDIPKVSLIDAMNEATHKAVNKIIKQYESEGRR